MPDQFAIEGHVFSEMEGIAIEVRPLGYPKWERPNGFVWLFQPAGLSQPIEVRMTGGESYVELLFNPMTATVDEERSHFQ